MEADSPCGEILEAPAESEPNHEGRARPKRPAYLWVALFLCLGSGFVNLHSVLGGPAVPERARWIARFFPIEFVHVSRFAAMLAGLALVILSLNIWRRKRRAYHLALAAALGSVFFHLTKGLDYEEALFAAALASVLFASRRAFTVGSSTPELRSAWKRFALALGCALGYGIAGFWLLDKREFGIDFSLADSIRKTFAFSVFLGDPSLTPHTRYAAWFLDSLYLISAVAIAYAVAAIFRPVVYRYRTLPHERQLAKQIVERHGNSPTDFFKYWPDKTFFFSSSHRSFLAYRAAAGYALVLGDPVGPQEEVRSLIREFLAICDSNDWEAAFYQVGFHSLPIYEGLGFRKLKVGEDAVVDLSTFSLQGKANSKLRSKVNQFTKLGIRFVCYEPPVSAQVLSQARAVSDSWLSLPGKRERSFALGQFDPDYVRQTPVYAALDASGRMLGFVNAIPSFRPGESTIDLMRHDADSPPGTMDFVFTKVMLAMKEQGFALFNLGMAPMSGFQPQEKPGPEEKAAHYLMQRLNFIFNYRGLREYKAKFATMWEPRYLVYRNVAQLPGLARAMVQIMEFHR